MNYQVRPDSRVGGIHLTGPDRRGSAPGPVRWGPIQAWRLSPGCWRGLSWPGAAGGEQVAVADRAVPGGQFHDPAEDHAAAA